jgi:hypothetical protein
MSHQDRVGTCHLKKQLRYLRFTTLKSQICIKKSLMMLISEKRMIHKNLKKNLKYNLSLSKQP